MMKSMWLLFCFVGFGQELTLQQIMEDPYWIGELPSSVSLSLDGKTVYFSVPQPRPNLPKWKAFETQSQTLRDTNRNDMLTVLRNDLLHLGDITALNINGDLWVSRKGDEPKPLVINETSLQLVRFTDDGRLIYMERNNLFAIQLETGQTTQLTNFKFEDESKDEEDWYRREEKGMLDYVANLYLRDDALDARRAQRKKIGSLTRAETTYLGNGYELAGLFGQEARYVMDISPDQRFLAVVLEPENEGDRTEYANFINKEVVVKALKARPKVGHKTPTWKMALVDRKSGDLRWLKVDDLPQVERDPLADIKESLSEADREYLPKNGEGPRPVRFLPGGFQPNGNRFLMTAYSRDYKDRWIFLIDPDSMASELVHHHYDEAWVPYILRSLSISPYVSGAAFWARNGKSVAFLSDHSGYQHLYLYHLKNKKLKALTQGEYEIHHPIESRDGKSWYLHASKTHPGDIHFYRMPIKGGKLTQLTQGNGHHLVTLGPDGHTMAALFSKTNQPPALMIPNSSGNWDLAYDGRSTAFKAFKWTEPEVLSYPNREGKPVYARLYRPKQPNGAGIIFVHGAGYLQNAHKGWSGYFREYMFHNLLQQKGYTLLDPDYQASAGYGRDWRTAIYRHMGGKDLNDIVDGAQFLADQPGVDAKNLGVYGGSYGGFITLMALFTQPDVFQSGAALRPVTDWAYYNHWYTSRILNTPFTDPEAYRKSSPIYFADGLKGHLLIAHGMIDDNVHYQDSVRLAQKLIELRKHDWELSSYPVEPHGFRTPTSWYDEYRRIFELFQRTLR